MPAAVVPFRQAAYDHALALMVDEHPHHFVVAATGPDNPVRAGLLHSVHHVPAVHQDLARHDDDALRRHDVHVLRRLGVHHLRARVGAGAASGEGKHEYQVGTLHRRSKERCRLKTRQHPDSLQPPGAGTGALD